MSLESISKIVENAIAQLGMDPAETRSGNSGQWNIAKNENVQLMMDVWEEQGHWFFQTLSPVCPLGDENNPEFLRLLLEENHGFCEAAFTILDDGVFRQHHRSLR